MSKRILLIDDSKFARMRLRKPLEEAGITISEANGGAEGLQRVKESRPDLVVCDVNMPDIEGPEVVKMIYAYDPTIPVVMLTANPDRDLKFAVIDYNVRAFMSKIHQIEKIAEKIVKVLERVT